MSILTKPHDDHVPDRPLLELIDVSVKYDTGVALDKTSLEIGAGEKIAIVGPNGAGKSTLFQVIAGLIEPSSGRVSVFGSAPHGHICIGYIPQRWQIDWHFPATVADTVMMGRVGRMGIGRWPKANDWEKVNHALNIVELKHLAKRRIQQLSGGQQQRVFIARALAQEAEILLLDEPMTGLDNPSQNRILDILDHIDQKHITILVSLHDLSIARKRFSNVMLLNRQIISIGHPEEVLTSENLTYAFQSHLHFYHEEGGQLAVSDMCCDTAGNDDA